MSKALATKNVAAVLLSVAMVLGFAFAFATPAKADTASDLQAQVAALLAQIAALQGSSASTSASCHTFTQNLNMGKSGGEVMWVQQFLNSMPDTRVSASGAGSPGNETSYFGAATKAAVIKFQNKYSADILTPVGLSVGNGNWYASTRAKANAICSTQGTGTGTATGTGTGTGTATGTTAGGNIVVGASAQPANSLAPGGASRVPFTTFTLTNTSGSPVTISSVAVQRTGLASDAVFSGLILVDENGTQLGTSRTLNSNHQANVGDPFVINPGQTKTITVAGNMQSKATLASYSGQVVSLSVIGVNTSATVTGSLPITGASQTINSTLTIGTVTASLGSADLNAEQTNQAIGSTNLTGASIRLTAGSAEDVWVKSIRWNQSGSAGSGDIANVMTVVDGTNYPTTVSSDGKYYTTVFPGNGIQILKGLNKELTLKFDTVGGPSRTVSFDVYKNTDIFVAGGTYGYGLTATPSGSTATTATNASEFLTSDGTTAGSALTPFYSGSVFDVSAGTVTSLSRANEVPAQNISLGAANQPLGGFAMDVKGEPISVQQETYHITYTANASDNGEYLTSVRLVNENGAVVAGPVDAVADGAQQKVTFTDTVTFPTGRHVYTLQGQLPSTISNGQTLQASTTPLSDWQNATGQSTGNSISLSSLSSVVTGNTMTVRTGSVVVSIAAQPAAQTIVAGVSGQAVSALNFDATQSGEDVRFTSAKFSFTNTITGGNITNCFAYDGTTRLNDTAVNPTTGAPTEYTFTFNTALLVPKGTVKTVTIKCDVPAGLTGSFKWGVAVQPGTSSDTFNGTGLSSTSTIYPTASANAGNQMSLTGAGALTVSLDPSSPSYTIAAVGNNGITGQTMSVLRFSGTNEDMRLDRVALQLTGTASSSPNNVNQVTLWAPVDSSGKYSASGTMTQVGSAIFAGVYNATSTLTSTLIIPANQYAVVTVKGDLAGISLNGSGTEGALIKVDYDGGDPTGTRAIGASSGSTVVQTSSSDTAAAGVRTFKTKPVVVAPISGTGTTLVAQGGVELYRFSVAANSAGDVGINKITVNIATSSDSTVVGSTSVSNVKLYAFTDSAMSQGAPGFTSGLVSCAGPSNTACTNLGAANGDNDVIVNQSGLDKIEVPAGTTYYFKVVGDVTQNGTATGSRTGTVSTKLSGDSDYPSFASGTLMGTVATIQSNTANNNLIWSPNATTTSLSTHVDWTNGFGVDGLPAGGSNTVTLSK